MSICNVNTMLIKKCFFLNNIYPFVCSGLCMKRLDRLWCDGLMLLQVTSAIFIFMFRKNKHSTLEKSVATPSIMIYAVKAFDSLQWRDTVVTCNQVSLTLNSYNWISKYLHVLSTYVFSCFSFKGRYINRTLDQHLDLPTWVDYIAATYLSLTDAS